MARKNTKGTAQLGAELDASLVGEFRAWVKGRGETLRDHLEMALRRHMGNPPGLFRPEIPPLPPEPPPEPAPRRKGGAR